MVYFGPHISTVVNFKQRPTTLTLSHATLAHALDVMDYYSSKAEVLSLFIKHSQPYVTTQAPNQP